MFPILQQVTPDAPILVAPGLVGEDVSDITSGIRGLAERVGYRYAEVERNHRLRFLFDPLRMLGQTEFIERYLRGENPFPLSVEIDPSNACNHDCAFCIYHSMHQPGRSERLPAARLFSALDELRGLGCRSVLFIGGGEPMTHPNTVDAVERAVEHGMSCGLVTNGSLVRGDKARRLKKAATYVRFSLDAATRATHQALHGHDDFLKIVCNLRQLAWSDGACTVGTGFFINERNAKEIAGCARMVKDAGADYIQFKSYSGLPIEAALHRRMLEELERALDLSDAKFDVHIADRIFENHTYQVRGYSRCHFQGMKTVINADGWVYLCAQKRTSPSGRVGNILEKTLAEIWSSTERQRVVENLNLLRCPYCVHDKQNKTIEFMAHFSAPHRGFY